MINRLRKRSLMVGVTVLLVTNFFVWYSVKASPNSLTVTFLNVGQGDAIYIETPNGNQMLIDAGPDNSVLRELGKVMPFYDRTIDVALFTHPDKDHIGGFPEVFDRFSISYVLHPGVATDTGTYATLLEKIVREGSVELLGRRGMRIRLDSGVFFDILFPDRDTEDWETNEASIIGKLIYGDTSILFTGDAPENIEEYLVAIDGNNLQSNVLKVGHHGSKTSTSETFLGFVRPEAAVISAGRNNKYGHPHKEVIDALEKFDVIELGTYKEDRITFVSDGKRIWKK